MSRSRIALVTAAVLVWGLISFAAEPAQQPPADAAGRQGGVGPAGARGGGGPRGGGRGGGRAGGPQRKRVLAWADTRNGQAQHESVGHALATIERLGYDSGMWDTFIRTDSNIVSATPKKTDGSPASGGPNLGNVDAIFFMGHRDVPLEAAQQAELLQYVKDGHGFVAAHVGLTAFEAWPEFGDLIGARFDGHPVTGAGVVINENQAFPATKHFPAVFDFNDEFYQASQFSRDQIDVLLRLDVKPGTPGIHPDGDYPLAWAKTYGKGRVFYGSFAHSSATWDIRDVQQMYFQAMLWALNLTDAQPAPHSMRAGVAAPAGARGAAPQ